MGRRSVAGCGTIVRMNRPGFPVTVLFESPPTVRGPAPAVAVLAERYGIGFTDIVKRPTAGSAELRPREFREGVARLEALVGRLEPGVVWFQGALAWRAFARHAGWRVSGEVEWGAQEWRIRLSSSYSRRETGGRCNRTMRTRSNAYSLALKRHQRSATWTCPASGCTPSRAISQVSGRLRCPAIGV